MSTTLTPTRSSSTANSKDSFSLLRKEMEELLSNFWGASPINYLSQAIATSWNSTELLNAIFETTYLGSRGARVAQKAEKADTSYGELKVLQ